MSQPKTLDLTQSVYHLSMAHPEIKEILFELGFTDIVKLGMLQTAGRFMTILKGAQMKHIDLNLIIQKFRERGFEPIGGENHEQGN